MTFIFANQLRNIFRYMRNPSTLAMLTKMKRLNKKKYFKIFNLDGPIEILDVEKEAI